MPSRGFSMLKCVLVASLFAAACGFSLQQSRTGLKHQDVLFSSSGLTESIQRRPYLPRLQNFELAASTAAAAPLEQSVEGQQLVPYGIHMKLGKKKRILNITGFFFLFNTMLTCALLFPFTVLSYLWAMAFDRRRRRAVDNCVHWWAKLSMLSVFYRPKEIVGAEHLPDDAEGVLYLANHTSFLDILTLSGFLPRNFKYVSKVEILKIPLIGWAMQMAAHIAVRRMDRRSQIETVKSTIQSLKDGNSVTMFPEGTRTKTGRMGDFKKGPFTIAKKAGARVVPISLCNVTKWFPSWAVMPLGRPTDVRVVIHPPIDPKDLTEAELMERAFAAIESGLPDFQRPLPAERAKLAAKRASSAAAPPSSQRRAAAAQPQEAGGEGQGRGEKMEN
uniref:1-acyl-sn-glycerol-3-phosphate acyltransferase n=1 Tax=Heterosigma akashiwo TaxID=2829 RepID=A0A7S3Y5W9_HETAK